MATFEPDASEHIEENRLLRQAITEARRHLDSSSARLREVLDQEVFIEATPMEVESAMQSAAAAIAAASRRLQQATSARVTTPIPGGPTRQQGQFLAYIREYSKNHLGVAPTHAEFQRFFNLTPPSVNSMLKRLNERGYIRRIPGKARAIELTIDPDLIPVLSRPFKF